MIFDCHIHTKHFSTDAKMTIDECLNALKCNNISGIITEHIDYDYPDPAQYVFDPNEYFTEFIKYRSDTLAHLDYISRYSHYDDPYIHYSDYHRYIDEILNYIISNDKAIEINTRLFDDEKAVNTIDEIMSVYSKMGGKYITFGSDAHIASNIGMNFKKASNIAQRYNLHPVYFENRNMQYA